jgi:hypothetical protein
MSEYKMNIGEVLRRAGVVTQGQIDDAVTMMELRPGTMIGEALVLIGACRMQDVITALDRQHRMAAPGSDTIAALAEIVDDAGAVVRRIASELLPMVYVTDRMDR